MAKTQTKKGKMSFNNIYPSIKCRSEENILIYSQNEYTYQSSNIAVNIIVSIGYQQSYTDLFIFLCHIETMSKMCLYSKHMWGFAQCIS